MQLIGIQEHDMIVHRSDDFLNDIAAELRSGRVLILVSWICVCGAVPSYLSLLSKGELSPVLGVGVSLVALVAVLFTVNYAVLGSQVILAMLRRSDYVPAPERVVAYVETMLRLLPYVSLRREVMEKLAPVLAELDREQVRRVDPRYWRHMYRPFARGTYRHRKCLLHIVGLTRDRKALPYLQRMLSEDATPVELRSELQNIIAAVHDSGIPGSDH